MQEMKIGCTDLEKKESSVKKWPWKYRIAVRMRSAVSCSKLDVSLEHKLLVVSVQIFCVFGGFAMLVAVIFDIHTVATDFYLKRFVILPCTCC